MLRDLLEKLRGCELIRLCEILQMLHSQLIMHLNLLGFAASQRTRKYKNITMLTPLIAK